MLAVDQESINYAFDKLKTFSLVNHTRTHEEKHDALLLYCEAVGLDPDVLAYLFLQCEEHFLEGLDVAACAFLGTLVGLAVAENLTDREE